MDQSTAAGSFNDFLSHIPTFGEIIELYDIELLRRGGDLQVTPSGDIAITADGADLKLGDDKHNAMHRLVRRWCAEDAILRVLLRLAAEAIRARSRAESERNEIADVVFNRASLMGRFHALGDEIGAGEYGATACAGAVFVVLNNLLGRFRADLGMGTRDWNSTGTLIQGHSFGAVIQAGANNFRHHDEWARTNPPSPQQLSSIKIISAVLKQTIAADGSRHPFRRNVCVELLNTLSDGDFSELRRQFFDFAKAIAA